MERMSPWHSVKEPVHHDHPDCPVGARMQPAVHREGPGGRPRCVDCAARAAQGRSRSASGGGEVPGGAPLSSG
jgi:hypothetical protein